MVWPLGSVYCTWNFLVLLPLQRVHGRDLLGCGHLTRLPALGHGDLQRGDVEGGHVVLSAALVLRDGKEKEKRAIKYGRIGVI